MVHSQLPDAENTEALEHFKAGRIDVVWNVEKLTEVMIASTGS